MWDSLSSNRIRHCVLIWNQHSVLYSHLVSIFTQDTSPFPACVTRIFIICSLFMSLLLDSFLSQFFLYFFHTAAYCFIYLFFPQSYLPSFFFTSNVVRQPNNSKTQWQLICCFYVTRHISLSFSLPFCPSLACPRFLSHALFNIPI